MDKFIIDINKILKKNYPIEISFNKINTLSHFYIIDNNIKNLVFPFNFDINGLILNGEYKNYKIIKVFTDKILNWKKYILLYISFLNKRYNPYLDLSNFLYFIHKYNNLNFLHIKTIIIKKNNNVIEYDINYIERVYKTINTTIINKSLTNNHFYFNSFNVDNNLIQIKTEINRLINNRDKFKNIHFHLHNNSGGDLVPVHIIINCLIGYKNKKWMKNITKIMKNKKILDWDCWDEESGPNYEIVKELNIDNIIYENKYIGKIYLHINENCTSSTWFFITYLIYAFSDKIIRYSKKCFGNIIKFGSIESKQLFLLGSSGTTSGDGDPIIIKYNNNIEINCPTEQFISCSILKNDWNRFWTC